MGQNAENDAPPTMPEVMRLATQVFLDYKGWNGVAASDLLGPAIEGIAWALIEGSMDTSDREVSPDVYHEARATAADVLRVWTQRNLQPECGTPPEGGTP